jgi:hypothetical protein
MQAEVQPRRELGVVLEYLEGVGVWQHLPRAAPLRVMWTTVCMQSLYWILDTSIPNLIPALLMYTGTYRTEKSYDADATMLPRCGLHRTRRTP